MKVINSGKHCVFCKETDSDELNFGGLKVTKHLKAHYYCLLLSETITQSGHDNQGILGFLASDISSELSRAKSKQCCYCKKYGANLGCKSKFCNRKFHLPCGLLKGTHNNFNDFTCLCHQHRKHSNIPVCIKRSLSSYQCLICLDNFDSKTSLRSIVWANCCKAEIVLHISCIKKLALSAGYFTKCPGCNNKTEFIKTIKFYGVFVPERDASWELASNSFAELYYVHQTCDVNTCLCPNGRDFSVAKGKWKLFLCAMCGSFGTHQICSQVKRQFVCCNCKISDSTVAMVAAKSDCLAEGFSSAAISSGDQGNDEQNDVVVIDSSDDEVPKVSKATALLNRICKNDSSAPSTSGSFVNQIDLHRNVAKKSTTRLPYSYNYEKTKSLPSNYRRSPRNTPQKHAPELSLTIVNNDTTMVDSMKLEKNKINSLDDEIIDVVSYTDQDMSDSFVLISNLSHSLASLCSSTITTLFNTFTNENDRIFKTRNVALKSTTKLPSMKRKSSELESVAWHQDQEFPLKKKNKSNSELVCSKSTAQHVTDFNLLYTAQSQQFLLNSPAQIAPNSQVMRVFHQNGTAQRLADAKMTVDVNGEIQYINSSSITMNAQLSAFLMQLPKN